MKRKDITADVSVLSAIIGLVLWGILFLSKPHSLIVMIVIAVLGLIAEIIASELGNRTLKRIEKSPDNYTKRDRKLAQIGHWMGSISVLIMFSVMMYFCYTFTNIEM